MSCAFSDYSKYALYSVNVTALAGRLQAEALPVHGRNIALLIIPEMPTYWRFGLSGICDDFPTTNRTYCHRGFPPPRDLFTLATKTIHAINETTEKGLDPKSMNVVLTSWNETLSSLPSFSRLATDQKTIDALMDASAAFAILAVISDFFWMCIPPIMPLCFLISGITGLISSACALGARWAAIYRSLADKDTTALNGSPALVMVPALMHFPFFWLMCKAFENRKRKWMQPDGRWRIPGRHYTAADTNRRTAITGTDLPNATTVWVCSEDKWDLSNSSWEVSDNDCTLWYND
ncbi:hypothetical protein VTJ04DRAFT_7172 [Mycothermus thermophilus]|uniref:uncharacterized protein n=1 Tax=Humicola insolens TaxID=85995 RepID=UPI0037428B5F